MQFHLDRAALVAATLLAAGLVTATSDAQCETAALTGSQETLGSQLMDSCLFLEGDSLFVGGGDGNTYVFSRAGSVWTEDAVLPLWGASVAHGGGTLVIGDQFHMFSNGRVVVYVGGGSSWTVQQTLFSTAPDLFRDFGGAVAISGETLAVGQPGFGDLEESTGDVHVYVRSAGVWSLQQVLTPSDQVPLTPDYFGNSVAMEGDRIVVGAPQGYDGRPGAVFVYQRTGTTWTETAMLTATGPLSGSSFGYAIALDGETLAVAQRGSPAVYFFVESGGTWSQQDALPVAGANSIALEGDRCLVGAERDIFGGSVAFFERSGTSWAQTKKLFGSPGTGRFGNSVALDGLTAAVLAFGANPDQLFLVNVDASGCPGVDFSGAPTSGLAPLTVDFTDQSSGAVTSWSWDFGDGATSNLQDPSHVYDVGQYPVSLLVEGPGGKERDAEAGYIDALLPASASIRNGSGVNGLYLTSLNLPVMGAQWDLEIDHSHHGAALSLLRGYTAPLSGASTKFGELLVDLGSVPLFNSGQITPGSPDLYSLAVPVDVSFVGAQGTFQGAIFGGFVELTNAIDAVVGF